MQSIRGRGRWSGFRLIPVLEGAPLRWPRLREVAFWLLFAGILVRSAEARADYGLEAILPLVPLSGGLVWIALAAFWGRSVPGAAYDAGHRGTSRGAVAWGSRRDAR